jgi:hypothetical protein
MTYLSLSFFILCVPVLPTPGQVVCGVAYSVCCLGVLGLGITVTLSDPTDPIVGAERKARLDRAYFDFRKFSQICTICKTHVLENSKHCGHCDRCVDGFDHHCKWLNNCIGQQNYSKFIWLIASLQALTTLHIIAEVYITVSFMTNGLEEDYIASVYQNRVVFIVFMMTSLSLCPVVWLMNGNLIVMHIWLYSNNMTTYQYILQVRERCKKESKAIVPVMLHQSSTNQDETFDRSKLTRTFELSSPPKHFQDIIMAASGEGAHGDASSSGHLGGPGENSVDSSNN